MSIILTVHAGAWNTENEDVIQTEIQACENACNRAQTTDNYLDAALKAIEFLENHPSLDAGLGSILQLDGVARVDAAIATNDKNFGKSYAACLQVEQIKNPSKLAHALLNYSYHSILSGENAKTVAKEIGLKFEDLATEKRKKALANSLTDLNCKTGELPMYKDLAKDQKALDSKKLSTVGVVACDTKTKNIVSITSTGGLDFGYPGRVGDTALLGHGIFCDENVAIATTGEGDKMIQRLTAKKVAEFYDKGSNIQEACELAVKDLLDYQNGECGLIAIDKDGNVGIAKSTTFMATKTISF